MASKLEFDSAPAPPVSDGERKLEFDAPAAAPAGAPPNRIEALKKLMQANDEANRPRGGLIPDSVKTEALDAGTQSMMRPVGAAINAGVSGLTGKYPGTTFGDRYQASYGMEQDRAEKASKDLGWAALPIDAVAGLPANMVGGVMSPARNMLASAGTGFIQGALKNADSIPGAIWGGIKQGATDAVTTGVLGKVISKFTGSGKQAAEDAAKAARGTSPEELTKDARKLYDSLDNQGIAWDAKQTADLYTGLHDLRNKSIYVPSANPALTDHFNDLLKLTRQGATFNQLDDIRSAISKQTRNADESTRVAAKEMLGEIDKLVHGKTPAVNPNGVDVSGSYEEAKRLWKAKSLAEDADWVSGKAARKAEWKKGVNPDEANRGAFAAVRERIEKPGAYKGGYNDEQRQLLAEIVKGTPTQNIAAGAGSKLKDNANALGIGAAGLASTLGILKGHDPGTTATAASLIGVPVTLAAKGAGGLMQKGADKLGQESVNRLMRNITTGTSDAPAYGAKLTRDDLAKLQFNQLLARMAPKVAQ